MDTLTIDEVRSRLFFKNEKYEGMKLTHDRKSVIAKDENAMFYLEMPLAKFEKGKYDTYIMTVTIMEQKGFDTYKDNETKKVLITKQDYEYLTDVLKATKGDTIVATGSVYKSSLGYVIHGRKWNKLKTSADKQKEVEEKGISLED